LLEHQKTVRKRRLLVASALAASLIFASGTFYWLALPDRTRSPGAKAPEQSTANAVPSLHQHVEEASQAFVLLTERAAQQTVTDSRALLPAMETQATAGDRLVLQTLEPSAQSLEELKRSMSAGLEPVTSSARRAVDLFLGEIPQSNGRRRNGS